MGQSRTRKVVRGRKAQGRKRENRGVEWDGEGRGKERKGEN